MTTGTVRKNRGLRAALSALTALLMLPTLLVFSTGRPAFGHDEAQTTRMYDSLGNPRGNFSYGHHTHSQNRFSLSDYTGDGYNVSVVIDRNAGGSWVLLKAMSANNGTTHFDTCLGGQMRLTLQTWTTDDGLSYTETLYWLTTDCNHTA
ncbi:hypothetical protein [Plantactinospora sp. WMMB782]|uniref:hypothetical protein n=1 Tax=Plantactinospora sp. WMMB782 TaxID=3404121 RepID=UPI003B92EEEF